MAQPVLIAGHAYLFGTTTEFATASPAYDLRFVQTDGNRSVYIGTGGAWLGPYTAAEVGLGDVGGGGISAEAEVVDNTGTFIYEGYAAFGSATSAAVWKIRRSAISGTVIGPTQRADGNDNYDNVWDNRAALSYS